MSGLLHLVRRQLASERGVPVAIALVVALLAALATAAPRLLTDASDRQAAYDVDGEAGVYLDVRAVLSSGWLVTELSAPAGDPNPGGLPEDLAALWGPLDAGLWTLREAQPEPFRSLLGDPRYVVRGKDVPVEGSPESDINQSSLVFVTDPRFSEAVELVEGTWPGPPAYLSYLESEEATAGVLYTGGRPEGMPPDEILLHADAAERLAWHVGEVRDAGNAGPLLLAGTYRPLEGEDTYWSHVPYADGLYVEDSASAGLVSTSAAVLNPLWGGATPHAMGFPDTAGARATLWFPVSDVGPTAAELETTRAQAAGFTATVSPLGMRGGSPLTAQFASELPALLGESAARISLGTTLMVLLAIGPALVAGSVLLLATRLLVERRRVSLEQLAARGGSPLQLGLTAAAEAAALAIPPAALGAAAGIGLTPGALAPADLIPGVVVAAAPVALLAWLTARVARSTGQVGRADLGGTSRARRVTGGTVGVLALAMLAMATRSWLAGGSADRWVAVAAPVAALALAVLVVLRLYPVPVRAAERRAARGAGLLPFLPLARARRAPAGGAVPVAALVVGVAATVMATVLATSVDRGGEAARWQQVGADLRVSGPIVSDGAAAALAEIPGVAAVARAGEIRGFTADVSGDESDVTLVELAELARVQSGSLGIATLPAGPGHAYVSPGAGAADRVSVEGVEVDASPIEGVAGGLRLASEAVVVDAADRDSYDLPLGWNPRLALISLDDGADLAAAVEAVRGILPSGAIETFAGAGADFVASPLGGALTATVIGALGLAAILVGAVLLLVQLLDAPRRARVIAVLRTLGLAPGEGRRMTGIELAPLAVMSLVAGIAVGLVVPYLVFGTSDLRPLTGGELPPPVSPDPVALAAVIGALILLVVAAVLLAAWFAGRASIARELRTVDE